MQKSETAQVPFKRNRGERSGVYDISLAKLTKKLHIRVSRQLHGAKRMGHGIYDDGSDDWYTNTRKKKKKPAAKKPAARKLGPPVEQRKLGPDVSKPKPAAKKPAAKKPAAKKPAAKRKTPTKNVGPGVQKSAKNKEATPLGRVRRKVAEVGVQLRAKKRFDKATKPGAKTNYGGGKKVTPPKKGGTPKPKPASKAQQNAGKAAAKKRADARAAAKKRAEKRHPIYGTKSIFRKK